MSSFSSGMCLVLCGVFFAACYACKMLGDNEYLNPTLAAWMPVAFFRPPFAGPLRRRTYIRGTNGMASGRRQPAGGRHNQPADAGRSPLRPWFDSFYSLPACAFMPEGELFGVQDFGEDFQRFDQARSRSIEI